MTEKSLSPHESDKRWKRVAATLRRHGDRPQALIEGMHAVQQEFGHLAPASLRRLADVLGVPLSKVQGVATFYYHFVLRPPGAHSCVVCLGTACHLQGGPAILAAVQSACDVQTGGTTAHGELSLVAARCVGVCTLAPAVVLDGDVIGPATPQAVLEQLEGWLAEPEGSPR